MFQLRRKAVQGAGRLSSFGSKVTKRYATAEHGKTGDEVHHFAGSSTEHGHHHAGPRNESLGAAFFIVLGAVPLSVGIYTLSRPDKDGKQTALGRFIDTVTPSHEVTTARNALHTAAVEQAAFDRNLFQSSPGSKHVDLKFPETFNTGSPYGISAGQGPRNMDQLVEHYKKINADEEERKLKAMAEKA